MIEAITWLALGGLGYGLWDGKWDNGVEATKSERAFYFWASVILAPYAAGAGIGEFVRNRLAEKDNGKSDGH